MGNAFPSPQPDAPSPGYHLATICHLGRFWDIYLEVDEPEAPTVPHRARLAFYPADPGDGEALLRTTYVLVEDSQQELMARARTLEEHQLLAFLRSLLP